MPFALFYDTETTGIPLFDQPSEDPRQPHIVEFAAILMDIETRASVASVHMVTKPDGWEIPSEVEAIHGISTARANEIGVPASTIARVALELGRLATFRVGHSQAFDMRMVRIALKRHGFGDEIADEWKAMPAKCTAKLSKPYVPQAKRNPRLGDAYAVLIGEPLEEAHTAKADAIACARIFWAMVDRDPSILSAE